MLQLRRTSYKRRAREPFFGEEVPFFHSFNRAETILVLLTVVFRATLRTEAFARG